MNRDALEYLFEQMSCSWADLREHSDYEDGGYILRTSTLTNDELGEISACGAGVEAYPGEWFRVYDDE